MRPLLALLGGCGGVDAPALQVDAFDLGGPATSISYASDATIVALVGSDAVRLDLDSGESEVFATGLTHLDWAPQSGDYVAADFGGRVLRLAPDGARTAWFTEPNLRDLVVSADGQLAAYSTRPYNDLLAWRFGEDHPISIMDGTDDTLDGAPVAASADGHSFLALDAEDAELLWEVETETGDRTGGGRIGGNLLDVAATADGFTTLTFERDRLVVTAIPDAPVDLDLEGRWDNYAAFVAGTPTVLSVELRRCAGCGLESAELVRYEGGAATIVAAGELPPARLDDVEASPDGASLATTTAHGLRVLGAAPKR